MFSGCEKEIDVPYLDDDEEITRYITNDDVGKLFFSQENLVPDKPYYFPRDTLGYYVDIQDSVKREVIAYFPLKELGAGYSDPVQDFGPPFGLSQDAEVEVRDRVYCKTIRVEGNDTTITNAFISRDFIRYGYFMKLGNDGQKFSGWILRGFNGTEGDGIYQFNQSLISHENSTVFSADIDHYESTIIPGGDYTTEAGFKLLNGDPLLYALIERVTPGERLKVRYRATYSNILLTVQYDNGDSLSILPFTQVGDSTFETVIETPSSTNKTWDFIYFQQFVRDANDTTLIPQFKSLKRKNWVVPIKYE